MELQTILLMIHALLGTGTQSIPQLRSQDVQRPVRSAFLPPTVTSLQRHKTDIPDFSDALSSRRQVPVGRQVSGGSPMMGRHPQIALGSAELLPDTLHMHGRGRLSPSSMAAVLSHRITPFSTRHRPKNTMPQNDMATMDQRSKEEEEESLKTKKDISLTKRKKLKKKKKSKISVSSEKKKSEFGVKSSNFNVLSDMKRIRQDTYGLQLSEDLSHLGHGFRHRNLPPPEMTDQIRPSQFPRAKHQSYPSQDMHDNIHSNHPRYPKVPIKNPNEKYSSTVKNDFKSSKVVSLTQLVHISNMSYTEFENKFKQKGVSINDILRYAKVGATVEDIFALLNQPDIISTASEFPEEKELFFIDQTDYIELHGNDNVPSFSSQKPITDMSTEDYLTHGQLDDSFPTVLMNTSPDHKGWPSLLNSSDYVIEKNISDTEIITDDDQGIDFNEYYEDITFAPNTNSINNKEKVDQYDYMHTTYNDPMPTEWYIGKSFTTKVQQVPEGYKFPRHLVIIASSILGTLSLFTVLVLIAYTFIKCSKKPIKNNYKVNTQKSTLSNSSF